MTKPSPADATGAPQPTPADTEDAPPRMKRIAIVAVHGVIPHLQHDFQDQVATSLRKRLNDAAATKAGAAPAAAGGWKQRIAELAARMRPGRGSSPNRRQRGPHPDGTGDPRGTLGEVWAMDAVFPNIAPTADPVKDERPSIVRVHAAADHDAEHPTSDYYDVIEAYWSPLDKGKTNTISVLKWLLQTIFQPINTTARYGGWAAKARSDVMSILAFMLLGLFAFALCLIAIGNSLAITIEHINGPPSGFPWYHPLTAWPQQLHWSLGDAIAAVRDFIVHGLSRLWDTLTSLWAPNLKDAGKLLGREAIVRLALGVVGAFAFAQAVRAVISIYRQRRALSTIPVQLRSRIIATIVLVLIAIACSLLCALWTFGGGKQLGTVALWLVFSVLAFEVGKAAASTFITNFFGDVQIYCTHDANAAFYELRQKILDVVTRTLVQAVTAEPAYDRVYVFAHSLGSTISLDALMRTYNLRHESGIEPEQWGRIRGFVTFGTSLEKTRYFLNAYNQSFSATFDEWRDDYYGALFDSRPEVLEHPNGPKTGIYWGNYWFFSDFISDRITTYRSFLPPGASLSTSSYVRREVRKDVKAAKGAGAEPEPIAQNRVSYRIPSLGHPILHGDYLDADWFWKASSESKPSWLARLFGAIPDPEPSDAAIDVLEIVTAHLRERTSTAKVLSAVSAPSKRYTVLDANAARTSPLSDVLTQ